ncbi:MAG: ArsR family transcriptional regulator [Nitrosopumilaceae archaeon]
MTKGYQPDALKDKLIEVLAEAKTGLSGVEISEKLGVNRITMTKYLKVFAAEGLIQQKNIGNVTLWFIEEGTTQFHFPDDYFQVKTKYLEYLQALSEHKIYNLIRNCIHSDAQIPKLMSEVIIPAIDFAAKLYDDGKIGNSEKKLLDNFISNSIQLTNLIPTESNAKKNVIILSADTANTLLAEAASSSFHSEEWTVSSLGDMSAAIDVLFDLDLQKFLGKVWKQKNGIMIIVVFSETEEGLNFFAESVNSVKKEAGKNLHLILCGKLGKKTSIKADLLADNLDTVLQWSQTVYESFES